MKTLRIKTTRFGEIDVDEGKVIVFPSGIPGFPGLTRFVLLDYKPPLKWLQSVEDPHVAFMVTDPFPFFPDYSFVVGDEIEKFLKVNGRADLVVLTILSVTDDMVTANLCAPILINATELIGVQLLLDEEKYPFRAPLPRKEGTGS